MCLIVNNSNFAWTGGAWTYPKIMTRQEWNTSKTGGGKTSGRSSQENWRRRKNCRTKTKNDERSLRKTMRSADTHWLTLTLTLTHVETWPCGADLKRSRQKSALRRPSLKKLRNYRKSCLTRSLLGTFRTPPLFRSWTQSRRRKVSGKRLEGLRGAVPYFWIHLTKFL